MASENLPQGSTRHRLSQSISSRVFPMAFVLSLLMALVLVSYGPGGSLGCDLSQNHVLSGRKNLRLLGQMRRLSPRLCLQDRKDFAFPQEMVEGGQLQEAQAISVLHEMLQQSFNLFHTERSSAAWDTTLLEQLRTGLHQQLDDLDACLGQVMGEEDSALGRTGPTLAVKRYFQGVHVYLKEKEYGDCAWETVRVEIMRSLSSSVSLQERSYSLLRFQQGRSLEVCQNLLWQLPSTPQHCLEFRMDFQMPEEMKQAQQFRKEDAVLVMYEMLQHIFNILTRDFSSTGWSDAIIEHLREELYGQMNRLEPIQKEIMQKQTSTMGDTTDLHLRKYYFNLGQYLKSKEHNSQYSHRFRCASLSAQSPPTVPQRIILATSASKVDMDALEVPLHGQGGARPSQGRVFLSRHLPQAAFQVIQLLMESSAELLQEGGVQGSRGTLCVEEVEALLEYLVEHRDGLGLLELAATHLLLRESEVFPVPQTGKREIAFI
ncbi:hypothetical protein R6Z07F_002592 [Ovis aries]